MLKNEIRLKRKEYNKQYYLKHKKRLLARNKKYRSDPKIKERLKAQAKAYRFNNRFKINAKIRKYRSDPKNKERLKAQAKAYRLKKMEDELFDDFF